MTGIAYFALWIFTFAVPWENIVVIPGVGTISRLMGMVALGFALLACVVTGRLRRWRLFHVSALVFVIWSGWGIYQGTILREDDQAMTSGKFLTYIQLALVLWMIWELAPSMARLRGLFLAYVLGAYVSALNTIMLSRSQAELRRFTAEGFDPNDLAMTLALGIPMAWHLGLTAERPVIRWVCKAYLPVALIALGLTGSRGGMVAAVVALMIVPLSMTRLTPGRVAGAAVVLVASGAAAIHYVPTTILQRLRTTTEQVEDGSFNGRMRIWKAGLAALSEKPLIGYGTGGFARAVRPALKRARPAHNAYLSVMVEQGLLGFFLYIAMFALVVRSVLRLPLLQRRFGLSLMATLGVALLPLTWEDRKPVWIILALLFGLSEAMAARRAAAEAPVEAYRPAVVRPRPLRPRERPVSPLRRADGGDPA